MKQSVDYRRSSSKHKYSVFVVLFYCFVSVIFKIHWIAKPLRSVINMFECRQIFSDKESFFEKKIF
jgi:hypothetical protein